MFDFLFDLIFARLFTFRPTVRKEGQLLVVRSGWTAHLFSLGFGSRKLTVDPRQKVVRISKRSFWFFVRSRRLEFDWIDEILYGYSDMGFGLWTHRSLDLFTVDLHLRTGEEVHVFRFYGQGGFVNDGPMPDWCYWDQNLMTPLVAGNQESTSRAFVEVLSGMIGVPIGTPGLVS